MKNKRWKAMLLAVLLFCSLVAHPGDALVSAAILDDTAGLMRSVTADGIVLLKNEPAASALPLSPSDKVALFGVGQITLLAGGGGSAEIYPPYVVSGLDGMRNAAANGKFSLVEDLATAYKTYADAGNRDEMTLTDQQVQSVANKADTAVIYLSRFSSEGSDRTREATTYRSYTPYYSTVENPVTFQYSTSYYLSNKEKAMINQVKAAFDKVIVVLNVPGATDTSWFVNDDEIDAALLAWLPGMEGGDAIADVLCGNVNPSAKLPITLASSLDDYESTKNFGTLTTTYQEDIFVGYRQFETFDPAYSKVNYPFGYGLSYTNFSISPTVTVVDGDIKIQAVVKNTGSNAGREVVQAYFSAPQKGAGGAKLSKPAKELACFGKTNTLAPGESQTLTLSFPISDMASYDDTGATGHKSAYVLEAGDYQIFVGNSIKSAGDNGVRYTYHQTSTSVSEQLTQCLTPVTSFQKLEADGSYSTISAGTSTAATPPNTNDPYAQPADALSFADVKADASLMEPFIAQIPSETLINFMCTSVSVGGDLRTYGVPETRKTDGPAGIRLSNGKQTWYPSAVLLASTWDPALVERVGAQLGKEMTEHDLVWAPSLNIHRNPLCGRNFEYYSEDPYISGKMAAAMTRGLQSERKAVTLKHYIANNQEANRTTNNVIATERALREIYLKGFEIAVKEANPWGIMSSYNKVNGVHTSERYDLITTIPRGEWGFDGYFSTDWGGDAAMSITNTIKAGNDLRLGSYNEAEAELKASLANGSLLRTDLEPCAKRILEMILKTTAADRIKDPSGVHKIAASGRTRIAAADFSSAAQGVIAEPVKLEDSSGNPVKNPVTDLPEQVACMGAGRTVTYKLQVEQAADYALAVRLSNSPGQEPTPLEFYLDDGTVPHLSIPANEIPSTGYFEHTTIYSKISLPAGSHTLTVKAPSATRNVFNLVDYSFVPTFQLSANASTELSAADFLAQSSYITIDNANLDEEMATDVKQVSGLQSGRWVEYALNVPQCGSYIITLYVRSTEANQSLKMFLDQDITNPVAVVQSTEAGKYQKLSSFATLPDGEHRLRIRCDDANGPISLVSTAFLPMTQPSGDDANERIHIPAVSYTSAASGILKESVKAEASNPITDLAQQVACMGKGRYVTYMIDVPQSGVYKLAARLSYAPKENEHTTLDFYLDDASSPTMQLQGADITNTGYFNYTVAYGEIELPAGSHTLKVQCDKPDRDMFNLVDFVLMQPYSISPSKNTDMRASNYLSADSYIARSERQVSGIGSGRSVSYPISIEAGGSYRISVLHSSSKANAILQCKLDGNLTATLQGSANPNEYGIIAANIELAQGEHTLTFTSPDTDKTFNLVSYTITPAGQPVNVQIAIIGQGKVMADGQEVANGTSVTVPYNGNKMFSLVPDTDHTVTEIKNGSVSLPVSDTVTLENLTADTILSITFSPKNVQEPTFAQTSDVLTGTYTPQEGVAQFCSTVFAGVNEGSGWTITEYGVELFDKNDQNRTLPLEAAQSKDGKYGIRVFGEALIPGKTYVMRPYLIINKDGDEKTVYGAEKEFTVTEA